MKRTTTWGLILAIGLTAASLALRAEDKKANELLQKGIAKETVQGDLKGAIELYEQAVEEAGANRALTAKALLRLGDAYGLQGEKKAQSVFERIVREFSEQKEDAVKAQARLGRRPSSLIPTADDAVAVKDSRRSIMEGPRGRMPGDLGSAVFIADITPDGHARGPVVTLMQDSRYSYWAPAWSPNGETIQAKRKYPGTPREQLMLYSMIKREAGLVGDGPQQPNPWFHDSLYWLGYDEQQPIVRKFNVTKRSSELFLRMDFPVAPNLMVLSPDDKTLYLVPRPVLYGREGTAASMLGIPPGEPKNNKVITVDLSTRTEKQRLTLPVEVSVREVALSPDGRTLVMWTVADTRTEVSRLFRIGVDGSGYRELYRGHGAALAWAQDGRSIFFGQSDTGYAYCLGCDHDWRVMRIPADGGKEQFTGLQVKGLQYISLSPDGKRLAFDGAAPTLSPPASR